MEVSMQGNDVMEIQNWQISDPDIIHYIYDDSLECPDSTAEIENKLLRALKVGVIAISQTQTRVDLNTIRSEFEDMRDQVNEVFDIMFEPKDGQMPRILEDYLGEDGTVARYFDPKQRGSAISHIQEIFDEHFKGSGARFVQLLDYTEDVSPLRKLKKAVDDEIERLEKHMIALQKQMAGEEGRKEEARRGTAKGVAFEELLAGSLEPSARLFGDGVEIVGGKKTYGGSKKGDILITLNDAHTDQQTKRIIIEAKLDRNKGISGKTGILSDLRDSMQHRGAHFAIGVYSDEACPNEVGRLREYPGNRMLCSVPEDVSDGFCLELAYQIARTELLWQHRHEGGQVDRERVSQAIELAKEGLADFKGIKGKATNISNLAKELRGDLDRVEDRVRHELGAVIRELQEDFEVA